MANACWGDPDVYVVVEVANSEDLNSLVISKIQSIDGVGRTSTHIALDGAWAFAFSGAPSCLP